MKNNEILILEQELPKLDPPNMDGWFNYAVQETIQRATAAALNIREVIKPKPEFEEYQEELRKLQEKHCEKDENGDPVTEVTMVGDKRMERFSIPDISDPKGKFNLATEKLFKKHEPAIDAYNKGLEFLNEENVSFKPHWITADLIPKGLTRKEMSVVFLMVKKEEEAK